MNINHKNAKYIYALKITIQIKTIITISEYPWHIMHECNKSFRESCILTKQNNQLQHGLIKFVKINFEVVLKHLTFFCYTLHLKILKMFIFSANLYFKQLDLTLSQYNMVIGPQTPEPPDN